MLVRYSEGQEDFRRLDGYTMDLRSRRSCAVSDSRKATWTSPPRRSRGGGRCASRSQSCCSSGPSLLLLDEPTNHLDLDARNWLEEYLTEYPGAVILVSHDRYFLDAVVTRIADLNLRTITDYHGNYALPARARGAHERLRTMKREQDEEVARIKMFIDRFRYQATKAAQVQSRIKALEKVVPIDVPPERKQVHFTFPGVHQERPDGARTGARQQALWRQGDLQGPLAPHRARRPGGAGRAERRRQVDADAHAVGRPSRPIRGDANEGHQVVTQYFAQDEANWLEPTRPCTKRWPTGSPTQMVPAIRNILGGFLFAGDDVYKKAGVLSGGERTRLAVARMLLRPANLLLLDEPTNHLDLDSKDVLLESLEGFSGTLILVSHDRYFVDRLATKIIAVGHGALVYPGTYEEFLWHKEHPEGIASRAARSEEGPGKALQTRRPPAPRTEGDPAQTGWPLQGADRGQPRGKEAGGRRSAQETQGRTGEAEPYRTTRSPYRRNRNRHQGARGVQWPRRASTTTVPRHNRSSTSTSR